MKTLEKENQPSVEMRELLKKALTEKGMLSNCYSLMHDYSLQNTIYAIIQLQFMKKAITPIATYKKWQTLKRQVNKGEKAIWIQYPCMISKTIENEKGEKETIRISNGKYFWKKSHFAYSQTSGEDMPQVNHKFNIDINKVAKAFNLKLVDYNHINGNSQGYTYCQKGEIALNPLAQDKTKTFIHEVAHNLLEHDKVDFERNLKEAEAESVTFIVMSLLNTEEDFSSSRAYIQEWLQGNEFPEDNAKRVFKVVNKILNILKDK